jgi:hypothetical protein
MNDIKVGEMVWAVAPSHEVDAPPPIPTDRDNRIGEQLASIKERYIKFVPFMNDHEPTFDGIGAHEGKVIVRNGGKFDPSQHALHQLSERWGKYATGGGKVNVAALNGYKDEAPPVFDAITNFHMTQWGIAHPKDRGDKWLLRTYGKDGGGSLEGVLSDQYAGVSIMDTITMMETMLKEKYLDDGAEIKVVRPFVSPYKLDMTTIIYPKGSEWFGVSRQLDPEGRLDNRGGFGYGVATSINMLGGGACTMKPVVQVHRCTNSIKGVGMASRWVQKGNAMLILANMAQAFAECLGIDKGKKAGECGAQRIIEQYAKAAYVDLPKFGKLLEHMYDKETRFSSEVFEHVLKGAGDRKSLADLSDGFTQAAHTTPNIGNATRQALEDFGGEIIGWDLRTLVETYPSLKKEREYAELIPRSLRK